MAESHRLAAALVRDRYEAEAPGMLQMWDGLRPEEVVVVQGQYDQIGHVLEGMAIPFTQVGNMEIKEPLLEAAKAVFVNCGASFPEASARRLARFVEKGGFLLTTDWCLRFVLEVAFPGAVRNNGKRTANELVKVQLVNAEDPLTRAVFRDEANPVWWLEGSSFPIQVIHPAVEVLVRSEELGSRYGADPVIVRFTHGDGGVYHMISHLYLQQAEARDARQRQAASTFATRMKATRGTTRIFEAMDGERGVNYGSVQAATATASFVTGALFSHLTRRGGVTGSSRPSSGVGGAATARSSWHPESGHFVVDEASRLYRYRMPADIISAIIGRSPEADEVLRGDPYLSRRHVEIRRVREGSKVSFQLTVLSDENSVAIESGGVSRVVFRRHGGQWIRPGDRINLTPNIVFIFDPLRRTKSGRVV